MATTIRQVAAAAGVSVATASRALSGSTAVIDSTRQRVLAVARSLDYTPSRLARSLVTGLTGNVGVILPDITNPFYTSFLAELESTLGAHDVGILIGDSQEDSDREYDLLQRMSTQVDGLVLASSRMADEQIIGATSKLPIVLANRMLRGSVPGAARLSQVVIDVDPGFSAAVHHLHALGHRRVSYIDGPPRSWSGLQKRTTLSRVCAELGMALTVVGTERPDFGAGRDAATGILGAPGPGLPTAILAFNDQVALGVLSACRAAGIEVPGRLSVVGCDDSLPDGLAWPALTTIDSSARTLGGLAAQAILDPTGQRDTSVQTRLVVRASTAPARDAVPGEPAGAESVGRESAPTPVALFPGSEPHPWGSPELHPELLVPVPVPNPSGVLVTETVSPRRLPASALLAANPVIAVLRANQASDYDAVVDVLAENGVRSIELTLSTPGTFEHLPGLIARAGSELEIGIGTVVNATQAQRAIDAGARYLVTPIVNLEVIALAVAAGVPVFPGGLTPTELYSAWDAGATAVKIFPAETVGPQYGSHLRGPFPDLQFVPSGGIGLGDIPAWLAAGATAVSLGGPLIGDALKGGSLEALADRARRVTEIATDARAGK